MGCIGMPPYRSRRGRLVILPAVLYGFKDVLGWMEEWQAIKEYPIGTINQRYLHIIGEFIDDGQYLISMYELEHGAEIVLPLTNSLTSLNLTVHVGMSLGIAVEDHVAWRGFFESLVHLSGCLKLMDDPNQSVPKRLSESITLMQKITDFLGQEWEREQKAAEGF